MTHFILAAAAVTLTLAAPGVTDAAPPKSPPKDLVGKYICKGTNPDGSKYELPVEITRGDGGRLEIEYNLCPRLDVGTIEVKGDRAVARFRGKIKKSTRTGEAEYQISKNGTLVGRWHYDGQRWMPERLIPVR